MLFRSRAALLDLMHHLLTAPGLGNLRAEPLRGGLAPAVRRRICAFIEDTLDSALPLADLAAQAGLSEFHFQRMFTATLGLSPQRYVETRRIARAEALIADGTPLAEVAAACGFAHHSHLTRTFRAHRGVTPSVWRAAL